MQKDKHHCQKLLVEKLKYRVTITKSSRGSSKPNSTQTPKSQIQSKPYPNTATHTQGVENHKCSKGHTFDQSTHYSIKNKRSGVKLEPQIPIYRHIVDGKPKVPPNGRAMAIVQASFIHYKFYKVECAQTKHIPPIFTVSQEI